MMPEMLPMIVLAALLAVGFFWAARRWPAGTLTVYLLLLLVHQLMVRLLSNALGLSPTIVTAVSLWKDVALLALSAAAAYGLARRQSTFVWRWFDWAMAALAVIGLVAAATSPDRLAGVAAFRDYFEVVAVFYLARLLVPSASTLRRMLSAWLVVGVVMAALGIWQALAWTAADYRELGFATGNLSQSGIPMGVARGLLDRRPPSTLTGPNEFGLHMVLLAIFSAQWGLWSIGRRRWVLVGVTALFLVALVLSGSRSDLAGVVVAFGIVAWHDFGHVQSRLLPKGKRSKLVQGGAAVGVVLVVVAVLVVSGMGHYVMRTLRQLPNEYHVRDSLAAIAFLAHHPAGVGMGLVGPRAGFGFPVRAAFHVEGSLFQIAVEMGVWGLVVFVILVVGALMRVLRTWDRVEPSLPRVICGTALAGWVAALMTFIFLPLMQAMPLMAWLWFLLGLGLAASRNGESWTKTAVRARGPGDRAQSTPSGAA